MVKISSSQRKRWWGHTCRFVSVFVSVCGVSAGSEGVGVTYFTSDRESPVLRSPDHNNLTKEEEDAHREQKSQ